MNERKASVVLALMPTLALVFAMGGFGAGYVLWGGADRDVDLEKLRVALNRAQQRYHVAMPPDKLVDMALEGFASRLDPYCEYYTAQEWKDVHDAQLRGKFGGIGIILEMDRATGAFTVVTPIEETPAFGADILPGDVILEVDGKMLKGLPMQDVVRRIKGDPATQVTLRIFRKGREPFAVTLTRAVVQVKAVKGRLLEGGIGYIRISDFTEMMELFDLEVKKLQKEGPLRALVIDLRFNPGGLLTECIKLADRFLDDGDIVTTRGRTEEDTRVFKATTRDTLPPIPLVVLVNQSSASASEVFAGAVRDRGRAVLVGERTFGKGSVQTPFPLPDESHFKITTARYFTPKGFSVHREEGKKEYGLDPDFRVEMSPEEESLLMKKWNNERIVKGERPADAEKFVDFQLEAALEVARARLEKREPKVEARILAPEKKPSEN